MIIKGNFSPANLKSNNNKSRINFGLLTMKSTPLNTIKEKNNYIGKTKDLVNQVTEDLGINNIKTTCETFTEDGKIFVERTISSTKKTLPEQKKEESQIAQACEDNGYPVEPSYIEKNKYKVWAGNQINKFTSRI